jgi:membrane peptidoglycan carboxypeptidase
LEVKFLVPGQALCKGTVTSVDMHCEKKNDILNLPCSMYRASFFFNLFGLLSLLALSYTFAVPGEVFAARPEGDRISQSLRYESSETVGLNSAQLIDRPFVSLERAGPSKPYGGTVDPVPPLEPVQVSIVKGGGMANLRSMPRFITEFGGKYAARGIDDSLVYYTVDPELQRFVAGIVAKANAPHVAVIAMHPATGRVLAIADRSKSIQHLALHAGFPAASLFKVITAAAAVERANLDTDTKISFRGGTYTLEPWNYLPDVSRDKFSLSLGEALGRSCNPVFGRVALNHLSPSVLRDYSKLFGFNQDLRSDLPLPLSRAYIPAEAYELSRTGAGFGEVRISPIHAAALMSGIANGGLLPRPKVVDSVVSATGTLEYQASNDRLQRIIEPSTSLELMKMMTFTTTSGTSRKEFTSKGKAILGDVLVAGKTGTLRGNDPPGLNTWFIGAAPLNNPQIAVAVIVVNPTASTKASRIGRQVIEKQLFGTVTEVPAVMSKRRGALSAKKSSYRSYKKKTPKKAVVPLKKKAKTPSVKKSNVVSREPVKLKPAPPRNP